MLPKITQEQMEQYGVVSAPDELKGRPEDTKAVFDRLVRELLAVVVNDVIDAHNKLDEDANARIDGVVEELKKVSEINVENLGANNIALDKKGEDTLAQAYGLTSLVPTVYEALAKLGVLGNRVDYLANPDTFLKESTSALFGLSGAAVPDDVFCAINSGFARIVSGVVTGSTSAGEDDPNSITFPFEPKLVLVTEPSQDITPATSHFIWQEGVTSQDTVNSSYGYRKRRFRREGNTLFWWSDLPDKAACATCGNYVAIG